MTRFAFGKWPLILCFLATLLLAAGIAAVGSAEEVPAHAVRESASTPAFPREMADAIASRKIARDTLWVVIAGFLVFFMNLGFALSEEEIEGLDYYEHGNSAYPNFRMIEKR
ncbi:MAG TPA: hypothetical protein VJ386_11140 [Candidatus Deferrimicrobiaceae bacterium]|nr:hypothetical protein [Candidatus Deferrimicrobiaceae bacterium]